MTEKNKKRDSLGVRHAKEKSVSLRSLKNDEENTLQPGTKS